MPSILSKKQADQIADELKQMTKLTDKLSPAIVNLAAIVNRSQLFHLRASITRARSANSRALAAQEIDIATFMQVEKALDRLLEKGVAEHAKGRTS